MSKKCRKLNKISTFFVKTCIFEPLYELLHKKEYHFWNAEVLTIPKHSLLLSEVRKFSEKWVIYFCKLKQKYSIFYFIKVVLVFLQYCFNVKSISHTILHQKWKVRGVLKLSEPQRFKSDIWFIEICQYTFQKLRWSQKYFENLYFRLWINISFMAILLLFSTIFKIKWAFYSIIVSKNVLY